MSWTPPAVPRALSSLSLPKLNELTKDQYTALGAGFLAGATCVSLTWLLLRASSRPTVVAAPAPARVVAPVVAKKAEAPQAKPVAPVVEEKKTEVEEEEDLSAPEGTEAIRVGTRKSKLAMVQTKWVVRRLKEAHGSALSVRIQEGVSSLGDNVLTQSLKDLAAKTPGLFTKELEEGLIVKQYDFVVHSLKDVPTTLPEGLVIAAITEREDPRDALVVGAKWKGCGGLKNLAHGSVVGTSSVRREAMIRRHYPMLVVKLIRGNVQTRLAKLDAGEFDAIVLAMAGLTRLGLEDRIETPLDPQIFPYGVGQGALGIQCRIEDVETIKLLGVLGDPDATARCLAERALLREMQGGCQVPLGVASRTYVTAAGVRMVELMARVLSPEGRISVERTGTGPAAEPEELGVNLARELLTVGGARHLVDGWIEDESKRKGLARPITYGSAEVPLRSLQGA